MKDESLVIEKKEYILLKKIINLSSYYKDKTLRKTFEKLSSKLETAQIYSEDKMPKNVVRFNTIVSIRSKKGHQETFQLVLPNEDTSEETKVSLFTHAGAALIGRVEGCNITLDYFSNRKVFTIVKVRQQNTNIGLNRILYLETI